jgi:hypothetical protein
MIKTKLKSMDKIFFGGFFVKLRYRILLNNDLDKIESNLDYKFISFYKKNKNLISQLCDKYGSDKGEITSSGHPYRWPSHSYADFYSGIFSHCRFTIKKVFECGLGTNNPYLASSMGVNGQPGASLRVWRDYFPNAQIYGADIDKDILFQEDRIKTFYINQLDPSEIKSFWSGIQENEFDFMLDDGLHTYEAGSCLFENSINFLKDGGIYIIEDVTTADLIKYKEFFNKYDYYVEYIVMFRSKFENLYAPLGDNNLVVVRKL